MRKGLHAGGAAVCVLLVLVLSAQQLRAGRRNGLRRLRTAPGATAGPPPPFGPLALLFMVKDELVLHEVWEHWLEDARRWAKDRYPEAFERHGVSAVLTMYVHADTEGVPLLPDGMRESTIESIKCKWAATVPCMIRVLEAGLEGRPGEPQASFFIYVSGTTIPIKSFSVIYESLVENPRSRFAFRNINMPTPKHHQWVVLSRAHASILTEDQAAAWRRRTGKWMNHRYPNGTVSMAADDEHSTFAVLADALGRNEALKGMNDGQPVPPFEDTDVRPYQEELWQTTWVCWSDKCHDMGIVVHSRGYVSVPIQFLTMKERKFVHRVWETRNWFARKFLSNTTLRNRSALPGVKKNFAKLVVALLGPQPEA